MDFGGYITLAPTEANRLSIKLQRSLNETIHPGSPGYLNTGFSSHYENRMSQRLTANLNLGYDIAEYLEAGCKDKRYSAGGQLEVFAQPQYLRGSPIQLPGTRLERRGPDKRLK